jgi:hypothetical protein
MSKSKKLMKEGKIKNISKNQGVSCFMPNSDIAK